MANFLQAIASAETPLVLVPPQLFASTANGTGVSVASLSSNMLTALISVGAVNTFTSLAVKLQWSDALAGTYTDIAGGAFTTVTAANTTQMIDFYLPPVLTATGNPPIFVRTVSTLTGTSCGLVVLLFGATDTSGLSASTNQPPQIN